MKRKNSPLPSPTSASVATSRELDEMVRQYNAMDEKTDFRKKWDFFWSCHSAVCTMARENRLFIFAGDCEFPDLKTLIDQDGPEYSAVILFGTDAAHLYEIGVCVRGTPILRKFDLHGKKAERIIRARTDKVGFYFVRQKEG